MQFMITLYNALSSALRCTTWIGLQRGPSKNLEYIRSKVIWEYSSGSVWGWFGIMSHFGAKVGLNNISIKHVLPLS